LYKTETVDGYPRAPKVEAKINLSIVATLGTAAGKDVMDYLESITIKRVNGPHVSDAELRHLEGQRYIVALLSTRIELGHKEKSSGITRK